MLVLWDDQAERQTIFHAVLFLVSLGKITKYLFFDCSLTVGYGIPSKVKERQGRGG